MMSELLSFPYFAAEILRLENRTASVTFYYLEGKLDLWAF